MQELRSVKANVVSLRSPKSLYTPTKMTCGRRPCVELVCDDGDDDGNGGGGGNPENPQEPLANSNSQEDMRPSTMWSLLW
jgi:hypothetical protein